RPPAAAADGLDRGRRLPRPAGRVPGQPGPVRRLRGRARVPGRARGPSARAGPGPGGQRGRGRPGPPGPPARPGRDRPLAAGPGGGGAVLWFVPLGLRRDGRGFALALLAGLATDTAPVGIFGSWDYAWSITG